MQPTPSFWFGWPKEELSATERARQLARREAKLDQHMLNARTDLGPISRPGTSTGRAPVRPEPRDPLDLQRGLDVEVLPDSAYDRLFPGTPD